MKKIIAIALMLLSCASSDEDISEMQTGLQPVLEIDESVKIGNNGGEAHFIVNVSHIEDHRCPMDAQCIRAGYASASIVILVDGKITETFDLCIGQCNKHSGEAVFTAGTGLWRLSLLSIDPPPRLNTPDIPKKASIKLERIG